MMAMLTEVKSMVDVSKMWKFMVILGHPNRLNPAMLLPNVRGALVTTDRKSHLRISGYLSWCFFWDKKVRVGRKVYVFLPAKNMSEKDRILQSTAVSPMDLQDMSSIPHRKHGGHSGLMKLLHQQ